MGKVFFAMVAALACLALVESLTCNKCTFNILGLCSDRSTENCTTNTSVCYTDKYSFTIFSKNMTFNSTGCRTTNTTCATNVSNNISTEIIPVTLGFTVATDCCTTDNCNRLTLNAAPSTKMTFSAAVGGVVLASVLGNFL